MNAAGGPSTSLPTRGVQKCRVAGPTAGLPPPPPAHRVQCRVEPGNWVLASGRAARRTERGVCSQPTTCSLFLCSRARASRKQTAARVKGLHVPAAAVVWGGKVLVWPTGRLRVPQR